MLINPKDVIAKWTVEELNETAEGYFQNLHGFNAGYSKPFFGLNHAPQMLVRLGQLLAGMRLQPGMTVLDFGAGSCWLSRHLNQLGLKTISCDVSPSALARGKQLFEEFPIVGPLPAPPQFLLFDGHKLALPNGAVDRVICFDAFHHVPNQATVLAELSRVLKRHGIAGFCEPGRQHSQTPISQDEMRNFRVLENDIDIVELFQLAKQHGFYDVQLTLGSDLEVRLDDHEELVSSHWSERVTTLVQGNIRATMSNGYIFCLYKGTVLPDSRQPVGLAARIVAQETSYSAIAGQRLDIPLTVTNKGEARWLSGATAPGSVHIGVGLFDFDAEGTMYLRDLQRQQLLNAVDPGETIETSISIVPQHVGKFFYRFDLVSEQVCWFSDHGSANLEIEVNVSEP